MKNAALIYIVDSDTVNLRYMARILKKSMRCKVRGFVDGKRCIDRVRRRRPDIIITDFTKRPELPQTLESEVFLKTMKVMCPEVPVVVYSSVTDFESDIKMMKLGAVDFIPRTEGFFERVVKTVKTEVTKMRERSAARTFRIAVLSIIVVVSSVMLGLHYFKPDLLAVVSLVGLATAAIALGVIYYYDTQELSSKEG